MAVGNYEEGWSRIDGKEQAMAANGGSRIERSGRRFGRLQEEANESLVSFWVALKTRTKRRIWRTASEDVRDSCERSVRNGQIVAR